MLGCGILFKEWLLLRPKLYSMLTVEDDELKRAKGVQQCVVKKTIRHEHYKEVCFIHNFILYTFITK
jgi:hypothetical protein